MKQGYHAGFVLLVFIFVQIQVAYCINCLNCKNIGDLGNCHDVIPCKDNEICYIEKVLSAENLQPVFNTGCKSIEYCTLEYCNKQAYGDAHSRRKRQSKQGEHLTLCSECCFEDSCNTEGCGFVRQTNNVSQCYSCNEVYEGGPPCTRTVDCDLKLFACSVTLTDHSNHRFAYDLGCTYKRKQCQLLLGLDQQDDNVKCCDKTLCNTNPYHRNINKTAIAMGFSCPTVIDVCAKEIYQELCTAYGQKCEYDIKPTTTLPLRTSRQTDTQSATTTVLTVTSRTTKPTNQHVCPSGVQRRVKPQLFFQHGYKCYEFVASIDSWIHARGDCHGKGGHLLAIENAEEQMFISNTLMNMNITQPVWLGLNDRINEEQWNWDSGTPVHYINWISGRYLDQYHDQEDCGIFLTSRKGQWDDVDCNAVTSAGMLSYPWVCQYSKTGNDTAGIFVGA